MRRFNRVYYELKPYLPWRLRMAVRRWIANRKRRQCAASWPIDVEAGRAPQGWPGWPDGKRFAFVLTHDVESRRGLEKVMTLARMEMQHGFRSSFNFVPQGDYETPEALRQFLVEEGFEVGVHDLNHDGKLYESRESFRSKAALINEYLNQWGAVGFRSGFMHHNYEWLHDLDVLYDASSFDTDPFEPQPDGVGTIFPFWVPASGAREPSTLNSHRVNHSAAPLSTLNLQPETTRNGYVELPYTLPQDSTLFLLFREKTIDVWKRKLDWIVQQGGMALLNVHPDYICFSNGGSRFSEYSHQLYLDLLRYVAERYAGQYWAALPRQVSKFARQIQGQGRETPLAAFGGAVPSITSPLVPEPPPFALPSGRPPVRAAVGPVRSAADHLRPEPREAGAPHLQGKRAAVVMFSTYPYDPRPRRAAEAIRNAGMEIDVICLRQDESELKRETVNGVNILRVPMKRRRGGKFSYAAQYASFILFSTAVLALRSLRHRYRLVHVHNMPDVLVFSTLIPKLLGARVVLDLHDPMPELMMTIFQLRKDSRAVRLLEWLEKISIAFADRVLTVNLACKKIFGARSCPTEKIEVIMNSPDENIFGFKEHLPGDTLVRDPSRPFVVMCHGSIVERHGHDVAVDAIDHVRHLIPRIELRFYGHRTPFLERVMANVHERGLGDHVTYLGGMNLERIVEAIDQSDVGIIPNRRSIFTELNTPTRIFEYLARGVPVIAPRAAGIQDYFREEEILFFELGDARDLASRIEYVYRHPAEVSVVLRRGQDIYRSHQWQEERSRLLGIMNDVAGPKHAPARLPIRPPAPAAAAAERPVK